MDKKNDDKKPDSMRTDDRKSDDKPSKVEKTLDKMADLLDELKKKVDHVEHI